MHLRTVESAVELGIIEFDPAANLITLDAAATAIHRLADSPVGSRMSLESWIALLALDDQLQAYTTLTGGIRAGDTERINVRVPAGDDPAKPRLLELSLQSGDSSGGIVGACRDVTRERSLEEMRRQKLAAERASKAKSEFMSHVSHELRTPLNAILGFSQMMSLDRSTPLPPVHVARLDLVQHSGRRLLALIDQLLFITKIEQGKNALRLRSVNVQSVVESSVQALMLSRPRQVLRLSSKSSVQTRPQCSRTPMRSSRFSLTLCPTRSNTTARRARFRSGSGSARPAS
jgi:signal transduction histidine kinase